MISFILSWPVRASSSNVGFALSVFLVRIGRLPRPTGGRRKPLVFFLHRKVFVLVFVFGVAGAKPPWLRSLCGSRGGSSFRSPTPRTALEHVAMMQDAIEHGGNGGHVTE